MDIAGRYNANAHTVGGRVHLHIRHMAWGADLQLDTPHHTDPVVLRVGAVTAGHIA